MLTHKERSAPSETPALFRGRCWPATLCLVVLAIGVRALPWRRILHPRLEGEGSLVLPFGNDALYHLRRIAYSIANFPETLDYDPYINFPSGAPPIWTPAFDWLLALALYPWVGALESSGGGAAAIAEIDTSRLEQLAIWVPPLLGGLTVAVLVRFAHRLFGPAIALVSGLALCISSAHFWYSQIGFVDHHVAVALASTIALGTSMTWLWHSERGGGTVGGATLVGLTLGAALLLWPGCVAHVALLESGFALFLLTRRERDSLIARSALPGARGVGGALRAQDSATARIARLDSIANAN